MGGTSERPSGDGPAEPELRDPKVPGSDEEPSPAPERGPARGSLRRGQWVAPSGDGPAVEPGDAPDTGEPAAPAPRRSARTTAVLAGVAVLLLGLAAVVAVQAHGKTTSSDAGKGADTAATGPAASRRPVQASLPAARTTTSPKSTTRKPPRPTHPAAATTTPPAPARQQRAAGADGSEKEKKSAPVERTAATAVRQLAADVPNKPHICYRVYTAAQGWTAPLCDGTPAGSEGSGMPLTAVDIAVAGTKGKGTAGSAFVHDPESTNGQGHYIAPWSGAADGADNYLGSTAKDAPNLLGFTINVDDGASTVCQSGYVDGKWVGLGCDEPGKGGHYTFVGTLVNSFWLEAIILKV